MGSSSIAMIVVGKILTYVGYVEGQDVQTPEVAYRLKQMMVFLGIFFTATGVVFLFKYPINRRFMEKIKAQFEKNPDLQNNEGGLF